MMDVVSVLLGLVIGVLSLVILILLSMMFVMALKIGLDLLKEMGFKKPELKRPDLKKWVESLRSKWAFRWIR